MPVVSMMRMHGDTNDLLARLQEHVMPVGTRLSEKHGGLGTIVARTDDGVLVINLWETEEGRQAMAQEPDVLAALASGGFPPPSFEGYEVLWHAIRPAAVTES
jgi:hypothetical protein